MAISHTGNASELLNSDFLTSYILLFCCCIGNISKNNVFLKIYQTYIVTCSELALNRYSQRTHPDWHKGYKHLLFKAREVSANTCIYLFRHLSSIPPHTHCHFCTSSLGILSNEIWTSTLRMCILQNQENRHCLETYISNWQSLKRTHFYSNRRLPMAGI